MSESKRLHFTTHAEDVIREWKLDIAWVEATVRQPEWPHPDPFRPDVERRFRRIPEFDNRILRVACFETADEIRIITVFFDRDAREMP